MMEINILLLLCLGHVVGDFYLQPKAWVNSRNIAHHKAPELVYHALTHSLLSILVLCLAKQGVGVCLWFGFFILVTHYIIDLIKSYCPDNTLFFVTDQAIHLLILLVLWFVLIADSSQYNLMFSLEKLTTKQVTILIAYLIVLKPASIIISMTLKPWHPDSQRVNETQSAAPNFAGQRIGYLERTLILTFIIFNQFAAIGFLLAAKSIFRFGDLTKDEDKKLTEYVMLGTLTSFTITILLGLAVMELSSVVPAGK